MLLQLFFLIWLALLICLQMLCDIEFVYFDDEGKQQKYVLDKGVDLDYWNIRQFRRLLFLFTKYQEYQLAQLVIRPYASFQLLPPKIGE